MKTLKGKITFVYLFLVFIIVLISLFSIFRFYNLKKSIDGLIKNNYLSISAVNNMNTVVEHQNIALLSYINTGESSYSLQYKASENDFNKWFKVEESNITEPGEAALVAIVNKDYLNNKTFLDSCIKIRTTTNSTDCFKLYKVKGPQTLNKLIQSLNKVTVLNEKAMFARKLSVTNSAKNSMYMIIVLSILTIIIGFIIADHLTDRFLKPLHMLKENIKLVREGHIKQEVPILSEDEIGSLAIEFNNMIIRLQKFEHSTKGSLLEERNRSIAIVRSISDPLIVIDTNHKVLHLNRAFETFFQIEEQACIDKKFDEVIKNNDIKDHILKVSQIDSDKHIPKIITIHSSGKDFYFDTIVTKIRNDTNSVIGMVILFQNVTKLKKLERTKTEFVSTISHEFKTPLTSIMMGTSLIKDAGLGKLTNTQLDIIKTIEDDTERLSTLVNDLIQLSKIESDKALYNFEPCSIYGIVANCIKNFSDKVMIKEVTLYSDIEENLPKIFGDSEKLSWVINNLISNSIKNTNAGDYISVSARVVNNMMLISVKDTGTGIPEEYINRIFDKFVRITTMNSEIEGTGLGLSIAQEIVNIHKGTISCESALDEGSTFSFTIPLAK